ncbi:hypothetical protein BJV82DRAFT_673600 [Fennellomyces sp. T-0311]|nr:hypothetical protein BJV82DRAFT_673600 [Fennellomyces sp. T-0311]
MELLKSLTSTIVSKLSSSETQSINNQLTAQKLMHKSPTAATGYLISGEIYKQQNDLWAALDVYNKGLGFVSPEDAMYAQLEKETKIVSATITRLSLQMKQLPDEILYLIFQHVTPQDLLQCSGVCHTWCALLIDWPVFWKKLSIALPHMRRMTLEPLIRRQVQVFRLDGPMDDNLVKDALQFLDYLQNTHFIQKLHFSRLLFSNPETGILLLKAISTISPPLNQVKFTECWFSYDLMFSQILSLCSSLTHLSFIRCHIDPWRRTSSTKKQHITLSALTYLKLSLGWYPPADDFATLHPLELFRYCPNLVHLFLDSRASVMYSGDIVQHALKSCPRLWSLVWTTNAEIPTTALIDIKNTKYATSAAYPTKGLRRLVLSNTDLAGTGRIGISSVIKGTHSTLELLHLTNFGNDNMSLADLLRLLSRYEFPRLREVHIPTASSHFCPGPKYSIPHTLFHRCPALEVIMIKDAESSVIVDNNLLKAIAQCCPLLCHLHIVTQQNYTDDGVLEFSALGGLNLKYLEISIEDDINLLTIVARLPMLHHLHIHKIDAGYSDRRVDLDVRNAVAEILQQRGGSLVLA